MLRRTSRSTISEGVQARSLAPGAMVGRWLRIARFLGFKKVRIVNAKSHFQGSSHDEFSEKAIMDRTVSSSRQTASVRERSSLDPEMEERGGGDQTAGKSAESRLGVINDFKQNYIGFRANSKNIECIYTDLVDSQIGMLEQEDAEEYQARVKLSLIASGMVGCRADSITLKTKSRLNASININNGHFDRFREFIAQPAAQLLSTLEERELVTSDVLKLGKEKLPVNLSLKASELGSEAWPLIDFSEEAQPSYEEYVERLGQISCQESFDTRQDVKTRFKACRNYLLRGEGRRILSKYDFRSVDLLEQLLPIISDYDVDDDVVTWIENIRKTAHQADGTNTNVLRQTRVKFLQGKTQLAYDPGIKEHRCLAIMQELATMYIGYCLERQMKHSTETNDQLASQYAETAEVLKNVWAGMSHSIMRGYFPDQNKPENYQQLVLMGDDGR